MQNAITKEFSFKNSEGLVLKGSLELPLIGEPRAVAILAHCFTCTKDSRASVDIARSLAGEGFATLRFDFSGLGGSEGDFSNSGFSSNVQDLIAAYHALEQSFNRKPCVLIGHSLGGAAVLEASKTLEEVKAVVTIGAPSSLEHLKTHFQEKEDEIRKKGEAEVCLGGRPFVVKKQFLDELDRNEFLEKMDQGDRAFLIMHSPQDQIVPVEHARKIYDRLKHSKSFISLDGANHLLSHRPDSRYAASVIAAWASRYLEGESPIEGESGLEYGDVHVRSVDGSSFTQHIQSEHHALIADEPKDLGGDDRGMNPYELLLSSLGACTSMTVAMYARRKKWPLEAVDVRLSHSKVHCEDCEDPKTKLDVIKKKIEFSGDLSEEQRERLLEIAERCPVNRTLHSDIRFES